MRSGLWPGVFYGGTINSYYGEGNGDGIINEQYATIENKNGGIIKFDYSSEYGLQNKEGGIINNESGGTINNDGAITGYPCDSCT